jgi:hypothetical protein
MQIAKPSVPSSAALFNAKLSLNRNRLAESHSSDVSFLSPLRSTDCIDEE